MTQESQGSDSGQATDNENQEGSGSPHQGSDTEFKPPTDGSWIPRERSNERVQNALAKLDGATQRIGELEKKLEEAAKPPTHTREELLTKVEAGEVTQAAYDEYFATESENRVTQQIGVDLDQRQKTASITAEITAYEEAVPALKDTSSETYQRVAQEYHYQVNTLGQPPGAGTTAMAARSVLGPLSSLRTKIPEANPQAHVETGGGAGESSAGGEKTSAPTWDKLTARQKAHYTKAIQNGGYADQAAVLAELAGHGTHGAGHRATPK